MITRSCFCVFPIIFGILSCSSSKQTSPRNNQIQTISTKTYQVIAEEKYEGRVDFLFNSSKTYVLCINEEKETSNPGFSPLKFFVYDLKAERVIFEDMPGRANIKWISPDNFEVDVVPGIVRGDEEANSASPGYVYDCKLQKKIKRSALNPDK